MVSTILILRLQEDLSQIIVTVYTYTYSYVLPLFYFLRREKKCIVGYAFYLLNKTKGSALLDSMNVQSSDEKSLRLSSLNGNADRASKCVMQ